jgi:DNA-binding NarL/FixJ family response regulator
MIRVLLVDDQKLVCDGIKAVLSLEPDLAVVGMASNGEDAIELATSLHPDVVLMDMRMPVMNGSTATQIICERFPETKVLALSTYDDSQYVAEAIRAGAKGYLLKDMPCEELVEVIRMVHRGYSQLAPGLMEKVLSDQGSEPRSQHSQPVQPELPGLEELTARELEVVQLIGTGATNREIAEQLFISEGTVKAHLTRIFSCLKIKNRSLLAIHANALLKR